MENFIAWLIIAIFVLVLLILFRRTLKRLIFILVLLAIAFFIYGLITPSGAAELRYNMKTFPQRMASWIGGAAYVPYAEYAPLLSSPQDSQPEEDGDFSENTEPPLFSDTTSQEIGKVFVLRSPLIPQFITPQREELAVEGEDTILSGNFTEEIVITSSSTVSSSSSGTVSEGAAISGSTSGTVLLPSSTSSTSSLKKPSSQSSTLTAQEIKETQELFGILLGS